MTCSIRWMLLAAAVLAMGCDALDPNPGPAPSGPGATGGGPPPAGGSAPAGGGPDSDGQALYIQYCGVCHGADGSGTGIFAESIQGATDMRDVVQNGVGEMPAFPQLSAADVLAMEAYLASFVGGGAPPPVREPSTWQEHYQVKCAACHGAEGEGAPLGPQIKSPVYGYATWVTRNGRSGVGYSNPMPAYSEADLPVAVLDRILEWLAEAPQPRDGRGLNTRYCANCHGADGRGGPTRSSIVGEDLDEFIETVRDGEGGRNYGARRDYMPSWSRMELSDDAIRAIYNHLRGR